jgi:hypothetical protein
MHDRIHVARLTRAARPLLAAAALASGALVAGCGGGSSSHRVATVNGTTTSRSSTATGGDAASSGSHAPDDLQSQELAYSKCMRASGVPSFPDPKPGGGWDVRIDPASPLYKAANAKCQRLLPNGGAGPTYSAPVGVQLLNIAKCMRRHGIPDFPDPERAPSSSLPRPKPGYDRITDYRGWLLSFPATINMQSPAYTHAAAICRAQFLNRPQ